MREEEKYFNVPVQLFNGFMDDSKKCLNSVFDYAIYQHSLKLTGTQAERLKAACKWYVVQAGNNSKTIADGKELTENTPENSPKVGLSLSMFWDFYNNDKSDFDKICLLGYLAIKSILQKKPYWKLDNKFWLSRMDGKVKAVAEFDEISESILKYSSEYQTKKIKTELRNNWGLVAYGRYTRGFYVSYSLTIDQLVFEAEKRRKSTIDKQHKQAEKEALLKAIQKLNNK
jgi:hypothetical protein